MNQTEFEMIKSMFTEQRKREMDSSALKTKTTKINPVVLIPYNSYSKGGRALAAAVGASFIKNRVSLAGKVEVLPKLGINWGNFETDGFANCILNEASKVKLCADKMKFFKKVKDSARIPEFTENLEEALAWVKAGEIVMGRSKRGSCGEDIAFYEDDLERFSDSEFWVKYKKKKEEFRVHMFEGEVIDIQQKALRTTDHEGNRIDTSTVDYRIRNLASGFVFKRSDISVPDDVVAQAKAAISCIGLDFGAADVIWNAYEKKAYVLEINTAPGLEGSTIESYSKAIKSYIGRTV